jgi:hypothetical protein
MNSVLRQLSWLTTRRRFQNVELATVRLESLTYVRNASKSLPDLGRG